MNTDPTPAAPEVHLMPTGQVAIRIGEDTWWVIEPEGADHAVYELPDDAVRLVPEVAAATPGEPSPPAAHVGVDQPGVLWMAMRYALGRATYAVGEVGDAIDSHADQLTDTHRHRMAAEIATAIAGDRAGMDMDVVVWRRAIVRLVGDESARVLLSGGEQ